MSTTTAVRRRRAEEPAHAQPSEVGAGPDLRTYAAAAAYLGPGWTARRIKYHVIETGKLTPVRIGHRTFVRRAELDRLVSEGEGAPPPVRSQGR